LADVVTGTNSEGPRRHPFAGRAGEQDVESRGPAGRRSGIMHGMAGQRPTISTHVLDLASGEPAPGVGVAIFRLGDDGSPALVGEHQTDADGRIRDLLGGKELTEGDYQLAFDVGAYHEDPDAFFQSAAVALRITDAGRSYHVPLLLSPYGMSTYRGS
jgi:hydroxyisourate hydrolase